MQKHDVSSQNTHTGSGIPTQAEHYTEQQHQKSLNKASIIGLSHTKPQV